MVRRLQEGKRVAIRSVSVTTVGWYGMIISPPITSMFPQMARSAPMASWKLIRVVTRTVR